jgi:hypothetical protein
VVQCTTCSCSAPAQPPCSDTCPLHTRPLSQVGRKFKERAEAAEPKVAALQPALEAAEARLKELGDELAQAKEQMGKVGC